MDDFTHSTLSLHYKGRMKVEEVEMKTVQCSAVQCQSVFTEDLNILFTNKQDYEAISQRIFHEFQHF